MSQSPESYSYDVIIPVFNSEAIVGETIDRTAAFFDSRGWTYRLILVNDGSPDNSWSVLEEKAQKNHHIVAIDLLSNYGQHTAVYVGLQHSKADFVITMDDDLQNPPEEIVHLVDKILEGYDVVFGQFIKKEHENYRRLGSRVIQQINRRIFGMPNDLVVSNFRIMNRDVVDGICSYRTMFPYINGLSLMFSHYRANVLVEHHPRKVGRSNYNFIRITQLVLRILFSYSAFPLRLVSLIGFLVAIVAFLIGGYYLLKAAFFGTNVPGWAFFSGINIAIVSMLGEYVTRLLRQISFTSIYHVRKRINYDE